MAIATSTLIAVGTAAAASAVSAGVGAGVNALAKSGQSSTVKGATNSVTGDNVTNALGTSNDALAQQYGLNQQLAAQNGVQNQSSVYNQQQSLANQLGQMAQGNGPSVAQANLNNSTGQNVAAQAALMAGQRGAGANAGLIARQAAQQGGAIQQQAAGQGAALRQQEQLNAIGALQQQQGMLGNLATTQVGQQQQGVANYNQQAQGNQAQLLGAQNNQNNIAAGVQQNNDKITQGYVDMASKAVGGGLNGAGAAAAGGAKPMPKLAEGGEVPNMKENYKGMSFVGRHFHESKYAQGGRIPMQEGGPVPGTPKVGGAQDSYANDNVKAMLSPGEIVLPRSVTQSSDPVTAAAKFVAALKQKQGK